MPDFALEAELWRQGHAHIAGVDEAGRGPLAGPVVAAAVVLPRDWDNPTLRDSKKLSATQREALFDEVRARALAWRITAMPPVEIDRLNILQATLAAMARAVAALPRGPRGIRADYALIDGNKAPHMETPCQTVVKGDDRSYSIAAASILAKVARDRMMLALDKRWPQYGFAAHKGYPTAAHRAAIAAHGPCPAHRVTFRW